MSNLTTHQKFFRDFKLTIENYREVFPFIKENKLWDGFFNYSWVSKFFMLIGVIISLKFGGIILSWFGDTATNGMSIMSFGNLISDISFVGYELFISSGFKYVILLLLEVVIFHFARKTLEVLTNEEAEASLNDFIQAQIRMFKVVLFSFVMENVITTLVGIILSVFGAEFIEPVLVFIVQCFFLGFVIVDNYNEIYNMKLKQSFKYARLYGGVCIAIGVVIYLLMWIPVLGSVLAPLLGAVAATVTMFELNKVDGALEDFLVEEQKI